MFAQLLSGSKVYFLFNIQRSIFFKRAFSFSLQSLKHYAAQFRKLQKTWAVKPHILIDANTQRQGGSLISYAERTTRLSNRNAHMHKHLLTQWIRYRAASQFFSQRRTEFWHCAWFLSVRACLCVCISVTMFPSIQELMGRLGLPCARADNVNRK